MANRKEPKYKIGDTVVITIYGTVGKVTNIKWLDGLYVYEINKGQGLYLESSLMPLDEYEGKLLEKEHIDIEYKFFFGDLVQVKGYGSDLFKIVGFRTEIWRYKEDSWEDVIYELSRLKDGEWLEAGEEELTLIADAESADLFIKKFGLLLNTDKKILSGQDEKKQTSSRRKSEKEELRKKSMKQSLIDSMLDLYNDYRILHEWFGDEEYAKVMKVVLRKLSVIVNNDGKSHV
ncbi:hypothetical protein M3182_20175 [Mesobacillus maritimus]|uniref:hypothetical protein n=1 Tax=Mesobacillus maritimus TaxID=1643336 RepID=UPI00203AAE74|nr:hypothetical protein [Mesobacillus maritimus]MCM3588025.1 hypothetical protein [Mesobacillus maritimus]MCM3668355.1 hypothetical protein [Mesobacillus maritimus]